jgi:shikimate kinase
LKRPGPVFLTGLMGSGKSTVGRLLARKLGWDWVDLDQAVEKRSGKRIARIFAERGEAAFRRLEAAELARQARHPLRVVSCGGGVVLRAANRRLLKRSLTLYLSVPPAELLRRLKGMELRKRPLFKGGSPAAVLRRLQRERAHFYRACARWTLRAGGPPPTVTGRAWKRLHSTLTL